MLVCFSFQPLVSYIVPLTKSRSSSFNLHEHIIYKFQSFGTTICGIIYILIYFSAERMLILGWLSLPSLCNYTLLETMTTSYLGSIFILLEGVLKWVLSQKEYIWSQCGFLKCMNMYLFLFLKGLIFGGYNSIL